ncbi:uncharacterized protein LOC141528957 [Cotesia typhae]|uniref:uncharacterized protein LOC141528957 n=1 Tax=Cotesia typhae TaxID=2053667 RepID=UPI003D693878
MELKFIILTFAVAMSFLLSFSTVAAKADGESCTVNTDCDKSSICSGGTCKYLCGPELYNCSGKFCIIGDHSSTCDSVRTFRRGEDCDIDKDCPDNLFCDTATKKCKNPCVSRCTGTGEKCFVINHKPTCKLVSSFCFDDNDCADCLMCSKSTCVSPCTDHKCSTGQKCVATDHKASCSPIKAADTPSAVTATTAATYLTGLKKCQCPWWDPFCMLGLYSYLC